MACSLPHTDSEVEALVQKLINEDKGRQNALLELAFRFEDSCAVREDLRKAYEKCNDISQERRALICTLSKESSKKDRKLHLSIMSYLVPMIAVVFVVVVNSYLVSVPQEEDQQFNYRDTRVYYATHYFGDCRGSLLEGVAFVSRRASCITVLFLGISFRILVLGGLKLSESDHDPQRICPRHQTTLICNKRDLILFTSENPQFDYRSFFVFGMMVYRQEYKASGKMAMNGDLHLFLFPRGSRSSTVISRILILRHKLMTEECDRAPDNRTNGALEAGQQRCCGHTSLQRNSHDKQRPVVAASIGVCDAPTASNDLLWLDYKVNDIVRLKDDSPKSKFAKRRGM
ncbi:hypothetical protein Tco_0468305 [Tanacetum coccineum]